MPLVLAYEGYTRGLCWVLARERIGRMPTTKPPTRPSGRIQEAASQGRSAGLQLAPGLVLGDAQRRAVHGLGSRRPIAWHPVAARTRRSDSELPGLGVRERASGYGGAADGDCPAAGSGVPGEPRRRAGDHQHRRQRLTPVSALGQTRPVAGVTHSLSHFEGRFLA